MADLMIRCPATGKPVMTGISVSKESFETSEFADNRVRCPHCGGMHVWQKADAYLKDEPTK
jgi:hypothetical protein